MKIDLNESDIINEVCENHCDNPDLLYEIVDQSTSTMEITCEVVLKIVEVMKKGGYIDSLERIQDLINK